MALKLPLALALATGAIGATAAVAAIPSAPATAAPTAANAQDDRGWNDVRWDDDDDDRRRYGPMPRPNVEALRRVGMVRIVEVERDDGRLEVEGYDRRGREIDVKMDLSGRRVLSVDRDDDRDDDRWDDRWDD